MAVRGTVNPDGTSTKSGDDLQRALNFTNSSMYIPEVKDAIYGAFGNILNFDKEEENTIRTSLWHFLDRAGTCPKPSRYDGGNDGVVIDAIVHC